MIIEDFKNIPYQEGHKLQLKYVQEVRANQRDETIIVCHHPPVVTLGKDCDITQDISTWQGEVVFVERGGKATYHGPNQVILYPIIDLKKRNYDIGFYLNILEQAIIESLKEYQIIAKGNLDRGNPHLTGVWVNNKKIASIGIAIKNWITYHGLAINLYHDPKAFIGISPCGFESNIMTSLEEITGQKISRDQFQKILCLHLTNNYCLNDNSQGEYL